LGERGSLCRGSHLQRTGRCRLPTHHCYNGERTWLTRGPVVCQYRVERTQIDSVRLRVRTGHARTPAAALYNSTTVGVATYTTQRTLFQRNNQLRGMAAPVDGNDERP